MVPKKHRATKRKIVSSAQGSLLRQPFKEQKVKVSYHISIHLDYLNARVIRLRNLARPWNKYEFLQSYEKLEALTSKLGVSYQTQGLSCSPRWHIQGPVGDMAASGLESKVIKSYASIRRTWLPSSWQNRNSQHNFTPCKIRNGKGPSCPNIS